MQRLAMLVLLAGAVFTSAHAFRAQSSAYQECSQNRMSWVGESLVRMESVKPGMTRAELLMVFTTEGGISTGLQRRYVSRDCPYFKVDVEFQAVGRPERDAEGRVTLVEDDRDIIVRVSRPFLEFSIYD
jgi:hypothetical protein